MSAPPSISTRAVSRCRSAIAHISAVCPFFASCAFAFAPRASSAFTAAALPVRAAVMSAVSPDGRAASGSAPVSSSIRTMGALPLMQASESGVTP